MSNRLRQSVGLLVAAVLLVNGEASARVANDVVFLLSNGWEGKNASEQIVVSSTRRGVNQEWYRGRVLGIAEAQASPANTAGHAADPILRIQFATLSIDAFRKQDELRLIIFVVASTVFVFSLVGCILVLMLRDRGSTLSNRPGPSVPRAFLIDTYGFTDRVKHELGVKPTVLGRVAGTDREYVNYIVVGFSTVSRRHAKIEYKDSSFFILDQGSLNGTYVNDQRVNGDVRLMHGDRIRLNRFEFEFLIHDSVFAGQTRGSVRPVSTKLEPVAVDEPEDGEESDFDKTIEAGKKSAAEKMIGAYLSTLPALAVQDRWWLRRRIRGKQMDYGHERPNWVWPRVPRKEGIPCLIAESAGSPEQRSVN
ncbi:MAG: FHA domain-containing protein [Gammaproteobacteria bacterium]|nr:FHA domain-containing protein [Gammaproteobacteria bacterium]MCI0590100.1 FHA domain-containing protein [Gammaproteobacteria bacterium]